MALFKKLGGLWKTNPCIFKTPCYNKYIINLCSRNALGSFTCKGWTIGRILVKEGMYSYKNYKKNYPNIILKEVREGLYPCFYCGVKSESIDHFIPIAFLENIRSFIDIADTDEDIREKVINNQVLIPACRECNSLASDGIFNTPNQKKAYIKAKFRKRYRKILEIPYWEESEMVELGYILQNHVRNGEDLKKLIQRRIMW